MFNNRSLRHITKPSVFYRSYSSDFILGMEKDVTVQLSPIESRDASWKLSIPQSTTGTTGENGSQKKMFFQLEHNSSQTSRKSKKDGPNCVYGHRTLQAIKVSSLYYRKLHVILVNGFEIRLGLYTLDITDPFSYYILKLRMGTT